MNQREWKELQAQLEGRHTAWPNLLILGFDVALLFSSLWLFARGGVWTLASIVCLTLVLLHGYLWLHEAAHSAISKQNWVNELVGHLCGWLIVVPHLSRRRAHMLHHVWAGHPTRDPGNKRMIARFSVMNEREAKRIEAIWRSWVPLFTLNDRIGMWRMAKLDARAGGPSASLKREATSNRLYAMAYLLAFAAVAACGKAAMVIAWYLPALVLLMVLEELTNAPHHAQTPLLDPEDRAMPYWEQAKVTKSCSKVPIWSSLIMMHFNYHVAHHVFPKVPWYRLPSTHRALSKRLPEIDAQATHNEIGWSLEFRRVPLLQVMGHYFDKLPGHKS